MTDDNKETLITWGKIVSLFLLAGVAIIASAGAWYGVAAGVISTFYGWAAGLNLVTSGFGIWSLYKKFFPNGALSN